MSHRDDAITSDVAGTLCATPSRSFCGDDAQALEGAHGVGTVRHDRGTLDVGGGATDINEQQPGFRVSLPRVLARRSAEKRV